MSSKIAELSEDVHGQVNKVKKTGSTDLTATMEAIHYNASFVSALCGDYVADASGNMNFTTRFTGSKTIGAMVGKKRDTDGSISGYFFVYGCQLTGYDLDFPAAGMYKDSLKLTCADYSKFEMV
jgi:hypothetical protein